MVEEELDETIHWLEIITDANMIDPNKMYSIKNEANELYKINVSSIVTLKNKKDKI